LTAWAAMPTPPALPLPAADRRADTNVYVVGSRAAGKTTLLNRYLTPSKARQQLHRLTRCPRGAACCRPPTPAPP
jgi:hypothetical protein